jgi:polysaccharide biosynthesis/export protein
MELLKRPLVYTVTWLLFTLAVYGCGGPRMREGTVGDLLRPATAARELPLETAALMVERVETALPQQERRYVLGPDDVLRIQVIGHAEFSTPEQQSMIPEGYVGTTIKKDGCIYLPGLPRLKAAGNTVEEFYELFGRELSRYIKNPQYTVDILYYRSKKFFVLGAVGHPGVLVADGSVTLLEAIANSGGVRDDAAVERGFVIRDHALLPINLADLLLRGNTSRNIYMQEGDLVVFPLGTDQLVYVLGEVRAPRAVPIVMGNLSLIQAIAEAGGIFPIETDEGSIKLIRGNWQEPVVYTLSYQTVLAQGPQIMLQPGDRIIVQPTTLTTLNRYMQQILPFLLTADYGLQIYQRARTIP